MFVSLGSAVPLKHFGIIRSEFYVLWQAVIRVVLPTVDFLRMHPFPKAVPNLASFHGRLPSFPEGYLSFFLLFDPFFCGFLGELVHLHEMQVAS